MRSLRTSGWLAGLATMLVAVPVAVACVIPRDLTKQLELTGDEVVVGTVTSFEEVWAEDGIRGNSLWTRVQFHVDQNLASGRQNYDVEFVFRGGITPGSPSTTITPSPEHIRTGKGLMLFLADRQDNHQRFGQDVRSLDSYAESYSVVAVPSQQGTRQIVLGKGRGFAFQNNAEVKDCQLAVQNVLRQRALNNNR